MQTFVRDGISACCTTSGIEPSIVPDISIKQILSRHIYISCFLPNQCKFIARTSHRSVSLLFIDFGQLMSKFLFYGVIWYIGYSHSYRFQTFTIEKMCYHARLFEYKLDMVWIRGSKVTGSQSPKIVTPDLVDPRDPLTPSPKAPFTCFNFCKLRDHQQKN